MKDKQIADKIVFDRGPTILKRVFIYLIISVIVTAGGIYFYHDGYAPRIVVMDLDGYVVEQKELVMTGKQSIEDLEKDIDAVSRRIEKIAGRSLILNKGAVIAGGERVRVE